MDSGYANEVNVGLGAQAQHQVASAGWPPMPAVEAGASPVAPPTRLVSTPCKQIIAAFAKAQAAFGVPAKTVKATVTPKDGRQGYTYFYAPLEEVIKAVAGPLADNEIARHQVLVEQDTVLRSILWHSSGEWMACDYPIFRTRDGNQGFAGGVTYARRYGMFLLCGLAPEDDDASEADSVPAEFSEARVAPPPRSEKPKPPNKPLPETKAPDPPPETPHDPETGEVLDENGPREIACENDDWVTWGGMLVAKLKASIAREKMEAWISANSKPMMECKKRNPTVHSRVIARIEEQRTKWASNSNG